MKDKSTQVSGIQGLNKDSTFQTPNQVTFALNAIRDSHDGGKPEYQSEPGNEQVESLPTGYFLLGSIYGQDNSVYLFSTNETLSEIGKFKEGKYTTLVNADLGFNRLYPITGEYRIRNGCDRVIYWNDGFNPDRWFNEDRPDDFKLFGVFQPNKFNFLPDVLVPTMDLVQVNDTGGQLELGSYYFQVELLDKNESVLYKSDISPQVIIYDESLQSNYDTIDGGLNYPQFDQFVGGVPITTKSIQLVFGHLDLSASYLRINVAKQTTANQVITAHTVGQLIPINGLEIQWVYQGYNVNAGDSPIDYSEMLITNSQYKSSYAMEQVQNRLVRGNLVQDTRDYSQYQQYANLVTAQWIAEECDAKNNTLGNPKNPNTYWYKTTFQGDEVYAFGIQYLHSDGTWSPVLPLIGRASNSFDTQLLTVIANASPIVGNQVWLSDVEHLGLTIGNTVERWKVFNTATITSSNTATHPYNYKGDFAYYEAEFNYPDIRDCEDNLIWGDDITTSTPVRFFKFPDRRLITHTQGTNGEYILPLGVEFTVPSYPNADIVGHRFTHVVRDDFNKTITDCGWGAGESIGNDGGDDYLFITGRYSSASGDPYMRFESAETLYNRALKPVSYIKTNKIHQIVSNSINSNADTVMFDTLGGHTCFSAIYYVIGTSQGTPDRTNYKVEKQIFVDEGSSIPSNVFGIDITHKDYLTPDSILKLSFDVESYTDDLPLAGTPGSLYPNFPPGKFVQNNVYTYKKVLNKVYQNFLNLNHKYVNFNPVFGTGVDQVYGGDTLLTNNTNIRLASYTAYDLNDGDTADNIFEMLFNDQRWVEYQINTGMRHEGLEPINSYFEKGDSDLVMMLKFWTQVFDNAGQFKLQIRRQEDWLTEYYKVNIDYNLQYNQVGKFSLPSNYIYCSRCLNVYPHRLIFSPKSFDEEQTDLYRVTYTNDYIDLPGHTGAITGIKYLNNQLLVHTENTTYILQPNPQQIQTDQNTAYIGTGDFLSVPPIELVPVNIGYAGCQNKQHQVDTPFGHCWLDQKRGEVFKFDNKLDKITIGLEQWLREYLPSELQKLYYETNSEEYINKVTTHKDGIGCVLYYDPRFKRLIITKQEFLPIQLFDYKGDPSNTTQVNYTGRWIQSITGNPVTFGDPVYFINKSWTLSYGFEYQSFISWHSYRPYQSFNDNNNYFTLERFSNFINRHKHKQTYQRYYGTKYDFVVEYQVFDLSTDRLDTVHYVGYTYQWDQSNEDWLIQNKTFDKLICYNNNQTTGLQTLILPTNSYQNTFINNTSKYVIKTDQNYKISGIMDLATGQPVMTKNWTLLQTYPSYIDRVPNTSVINTTKSIYTQGKLWDKFVNVRLFFKPNEDYKKVIILTNVNEQQSVR